MRGDMHAATVRATGTRSRHLRGNASLLQRLQPMHRHARKTAAKSADSAHTHHSCPSLRPKAESSSFTRACFDFHSPGEQESRRFVASMSPRCGRLAVLSPGVQQSHRYGPSKLPRCGRLAVLCLDVQQSRGYGLFKSPRCGRFVALEVATLRRFGRSF